MGQGDLAVLLVVSNSRTLGRPMTLILTRPSLTSSAAAFSPTQHMETIGPYLTELVPPVLSCFADPDARVRYFACEAMYNIAKVARHDVLVFFNRIFDGLSKVHGWPWKNLKCQRFDFVARRLLVLTCGPRPLCLTALVCLSLLSFSNLSPFNLLLRVPFFLVFSLSLFLLSPPFFLRALLAHSSRCLTLLSLTLFLPFSLLCPHFVTIAVRRS